MNISRYKTDDSTASAMYSLYKKSDKQRTGNWNFPIISTRKISR
jgi:hypothetical protein